MTTSKEGALAPVNVTQDLAKAREYFSGRRVLITGAGGSVGGALAHAIAQIGCSHLTLLDHFDHALLSVTDALRRRPAPPTIEETLCDIRNRDRLRECFARHEPDIVIHAAALKHVHLGERHPGECVLTNLVGVRNAVEAAAASGAHSFLLISSDKAAAPVCTMGVSKRLAELYLEGFRREHGAILNLKAVRFGNVYGSQGSVVPKFLEQIARGEPVEVTHPDMQRYFMSLDEAVRLILQVTVLEERATDHVGAYVLDMGAPLKILDLARQLIAENGSASEIVFTGLREGEKLSEELWDDAEAVSSTPLKGISRVAPKSIAVRMSSAALTSLEDLAWRMDGDLVREAAFATLQASLNPEPEKQNVLAAPTNA